MNLQLIFICFDIAKSCQTRVNRYSLKFKRTMKEFVFFNLKQLMGNRCYLNIFVLSSGTESVYHALQLRLGSQNYLLYETCGYERLCLLRKTSLLALIVRHLNALDNRPLHKHCMFTDYRKTNFLNVQLLP